MDFWTNTLTDRMHQLNYEQLTVNQESETRQLIDYLGLDWDEKCLSPQNNTRGVATASMFRLENKSTKVARNNGKNTNHSSMGHSTVWCNHELGSNLRFKKHFMLPRLYCRQRLTFIISIMFAVFIRLSFKA